MERVSKSNTKMLVSGVMLATVIGKILGFVKELVLAYCFGAGSVSDAYLISQTIPGTLFLIIGTGIATCYVPIYIKTKNTEGKDSSKEFTDKFITLIISISAGMTLLLELIPGLFVRLFAFGFEADTFSLAVSFTRINAISLVISGLLYCYSALLQSENKYQHVAIANIPYNLGLIAAIVIGAYVNIYALSVVSVAAVVIQLGYQFVFVRKIPYKYKPAFRFRDQRIKNSLALIPPIILGVAAAEINTLIDRTLASAILVGGITVITYGTSLFNLVIGVFSNSISAVYYPMISEAAVKREKERLVKSVQDAVFFALYFMLPCTAGVFILREPIVLLLFGHGEFGASHVGELSMVFACYGIGFVPFSIKQILNNVYYSHEKTKKPMINTIISVIINVCLNLILSRFWGLSGLAIATAIAAIVVAGLLIKDCYKDYGIRIIRSFKKLFLMISSAVVMGIVCYFLNHWLGNGSVRVLISILVSAVIYFALTMMLNACPYSIANVIRRVRK